MQTFDVFVWACVIGIALWIIAFPFTLTIFFFFMVFPRTDQNGVWLLTGGIVSGVLVNMMMIAGCKAILKKWPWQFLDPLPRSSADSTTRKL